MSDNDFFEGVKLLGRGARSIGKELQRGGKKAWRSGRKLQVRRRAARPSQEKGSKLLDD